VAASATNSLVATVTGGAAGTATITATSHGAPTIKAQCLVTVAQAVGQDVYVGGDFGLYRNGVRVGAYNSAVVNSLFVDADGALHAAGYDDAGYPRAIYFKDGVKAFLPCREGSVRSEATAVHVSYDGHVYIAGYEYSAGPEFDRYAKLWIDGADVPLGGLDGAQTDATDVFAHGGNVYVVGQGAGGPMIWINQAKTVFPNIPPIEQLADSVTTLGGDVYVGGCFGLMKLDPANPLEYQLFDEYRNQNVTFRIQRVLDLLMAGDDLHAAGWVGNYAAYWLNHSRTLPPWNTAQNQAAEAWSTAVAPDGSVYVAGSEIFLFEGVEAEPHAILWKDGVRQLFPGPAGNAYCVVVK
jgi:hypothetical protein